MRAMNLPWDYSRCVGKTDWQTKPIGAPERMHPTCADCRRREPGHPTRQVYMGAAVDEAGRCDNKIGPAE